MLLAGCRLMIIPCVFRHVCEVCRCAVIHLSQCLHHQAGNLRPTDGLIGRETRFRRTVDDALRCEITDRLLHFRALIGNIREILLVRLHCVCTRSIYFAIYRRSRRIVLACRCLSAILHNRLVGLIAATAR